MGTLSAPVPAPTAPGTGARVVVGVDDPVRDAVVLAWARAEVAVTGARLTICRAGPTPTGWSTMDGLMLMDPVFARAVHDVRQRLGGERVDLWLEEGPPEVVLAAASAGADLVVLGPPGGHRSPAARIAADAHQLVVIVRPGDGRRTAPFAGHVVAAVGGGPAAPVRAGRLAPGSAPRSRARRAVDGRRPATAPAGPAQRQSRPHRTRIAVVVPAADGRR